jgi:hypothetical protein
VASLDLGNLFDSGSDTWRYAGQVTGPIFQGGANVGINEQADARHAALLAITRNGTGIRDGTMPIATRKPPRARPSEQVNCAIRPAVAQALEAGLSVPRGRRRRQSLFNAELLAPGGGRFSPTWTSLWRRLGDTAAEAPGRRNPQPDPGRQRRVAQEMGDLPRNVIGE